MEELTALIVEDNQDYRESMALLVGREGFTPREAGTLAEARELLEKELPAVVLLDLGLPDGDGLSLFDEEALTDSTEVVVMTGNTELESAVSALRAGAFDYLTKPVDRDRLRAILTNVARTRGLKKEVLELRETLRGLGRFGPMVGRSKEMQQIYDLIGRVAPTDSTVFVTGESGTGKELVADTVHRLSARKEKPFLTLNCGAIPANLIESELFGHEKGSFTGADRRRIGYFEQADQGTLFLDEITEMPIELQVKLLRVLETGTITRVGATSPTEVDVRVVAASNRDPLEAVEEERLREDLYYRLNVFPIQLPPLRARSGDVELLAQHFLDALNHREGGAKRFSENGIEALGRHAWPGNVRQLKNIVERAWILADGLIGPESLPKADAAGAQTDDGSPATLQVPVGESIEGVERRLILATLDQLDGDKKQAAEVLGISVKTLYNRLKVYDASSKD